jgi:hypothetical protein
VVDQRSLLIRKELKNTPERLCKANIPTEYITGDLIVCKTHYGCCLVQTLVNILVNILYSLNRNTHLNVYITAVLLQEKQVIQNNLAVIINNRLLRRSWFTDCKTVSVVLPAIFKITVFVYNRNRRETL